MARKMVANIEHREWSDDEIAKLRAMWDGPEKLSTEAMGERLGGRSSGSVIGKADRLGLARKAKSAPVFRQERRSVPAPRGPTLPPMQSELRR